MSLLEIKNLNLTYSNGKKIFENAEITLQPGESQALWSPNGTGKTSLFRVVTGLLKPQNADIFLEDKAVTNEEEFKALRLKVGFVLQHADDQRKRGKKGLRRSFIQFGHSRAQRRFELRIIRRTEKTCHACMRSFYETAGIALR